MKSLSRPHTILAIGALLLAACDNEPDVAESLEDVGQELGMEDGKVFEELGESFQTMEKAITGKDRRGFDDKVSESVDELRRWIDQRRRSIDGKTDQASNELRDRLDAAEKDLDALGEDIESLADKTGDEWDKASRNVQSGLKDVADALDPDA